MPTTSPSAFELPLDMREALSKARLECSDGSQADLSSGELEISSTGTEGYEFVDSVTLDEATQIYRMVRSLKPAATLEIGMCSGASTLTILHALEDNRRGEHHVCDPYEDTAMKSLGLTNIERSGLGARVRFAATFPEHACSEWPQASFAFIDASHLFDLTMLDFVLVDKRLEVGGVIGLHDLWLGSLQKVVRYAIANRGYEVVGSDAPRSTRRRATAAIGAVLAHSKLARRLLAPEALVPWSSINPSNNALMFLRKTQDDARDWHYHAAF